jgi:pilus assembly protein CpaB
MNANPTRTLMISVVMGVFAMFLIYSYSQDKKAEYDKKFGAKINVLVARKDILEMSTIDETMVELQEVPETFKQPGFVTDPADAVSMVASAPIKKGEQILTTKLLSPGLETGLSMQVAPGKRAVAVPIDESRGVAKLIRPGDRIDIITATESGRGQNAQTTVRTLMQNVTVLATGVNITNQVPRKLETAANGSQSFRRLNGDVSFTSITVEVTPREAQDLIGIMASSPGGIFFTLRNTNDVNTETLATSNPTMARATVEDAPRLPASVIAPAPPRMQPRRLPKKHGAFLEVN